MAVCSPARIVSDSRSRTRLSPFITLASCSSSTGGVSITDDYGSDLPFQRELRREEPAHPVHTHTRRRGCRTDVDPFRGSGVRTPRRACEKLTEVAHAGGDVAA